MSWRMSKRTDTKSGPFRWWLGAGLLAGGAALTAYFLDPQKGHGRRVRFAERAGHTARSTKRKVERRARYVAKTAEARARHYVEPLPPAPADGRMLLDRVESELFEDRTIPRGRLSLETEGTAVVLRGQLDSFEEIARVEGAVRRIPGVGRVVNLMHVPGTPAPNKAAAIAASLEAVAPGGWPAEAPPDVDSES